jgi:MFS family permease
MKHKNRRRIFAFGGTIPLKNTLIASWISKRYRFLSIVFLSFSGQSFAWALATSLFALILLFIKEKRYIEKWRTKKGTCADVRF